jgi:enoyl-CoA hydratase/carnithine racemase
MTGQAGERQALEANSLFPQGAKVPWFDFQALLEMLQRKSKPLSFAQGLAGLDPCFGAKCGHRGFVGEHQDVAVPVVAAVNGPAVGLGCSIVALSDIVFMAESAHLADPHVMVGLVAADGGPVTWPLMISLQLAKEYALTGDKIPAARAAQIGLANHVCPDDEVVDAAMACAERIARLPQRATEDTKRILNMHLERAVLATIDFALTAEDRSFTSPELRANLDRLLAKDA